MIVLETMRASAPIRSRSFRRALARGSAEGLRRHGAYVFNLRGERAMSKRGLVLLVYNLLLPLGLLLALPGTLLKMKRRGDYGKNFMQRFGLYRDEAGEKLGDGNDFWIHAVSVGEVLIARKLIGELRRRDGKARGSFFRRRLRPVMRWRGELEDERLTAIYNPVDLWFTVGVRCSGSIRRVLVLVEAEVWPNLVFRAKRRGIPVVLVNARLSPRSEGRYLPFSWIRGAGIRDAGQGARAGC